MPTFKVQREYINWEEITIEANSEEEALELAEDETAWDYSHDTTTHNYTGEIRIGLEDAD
jgi:hypothetical protein